MTITKARLAALRAMRARSGPTLTLTPGGVLEQKVHETQRRNLEKEIAADENAMNTAQQKLEFHSAFTTRKGLAKAQFNHPKPKQEITP